MEGRDTHRVKKRLQATLLTWNHRLFHLTSPEVSALWNSGIELTFGSEPMTHTLPSSSLLSLPPQISFSFVSNPLCLSKQETSAMHVYCEMMFTVNKHLQFWIW